MPKKKFTPVVVPKCPWHESKSDSMGYNQFVDDAERRTAAGQEQKQCHVCGYWFWPDQFGVDPITLLKTSDDAVQPPNPQRTRTPKAR